MTPWLQPLIFDFGLSRLKEDVPPGKRGTRGWMAPEVRSGEAYDGIQADIWSLGKVVIELCSHSEGNMDKDVLKVLKEVGGEMTAAVPHQRPTLALAENKVSALWESQQHC